MMNDIQIFNSPEFGEVRTVMIDGEPWFVAKDISETLGYTKTFSMMKRIDEDDKRNISSSILEEPIGNQAYTVGVVNESGLYAAIFGSKAETAKKFRKWVTAEVLPQLRKTGSYGTISWENRFGNICIGEFRMNNNMRLNDTESDQEIML